MMPEYNAWGVNLQAAICELCDWRYLLPPGQLRQLCPHCFQTELTPLDEQAGGLNSHPPELIISFSVTAEAVNRQIQQFAGGIWFAPGDLTPQNLQARLRRVYLPMWLVDSQVQALWQAEAGFDYQVVSHRDSFDETGGGWRSEEITETRVRWEPRLGRLTRTYHNIPAPALEEHFALLQRLGRFDLEAGQPYRVELLQQAAVRLPNRTPTDAWPDAAPAFQAAAAEECRKAAAADHIREFRWSVEYPQPNWTLLLLPLFTTFYLDDERRPQPVLIHGQSGRISGPKRASMRRAQRMAMVIVAIAALIFILSLVVAGVSLIAPPLLVAAGVGIVVALIVGLLAIVPPVIAWQINRTR